MIWLVLGLACAADPPARPAALELEGAKLVMDDGSALAAERAQLDAQGVGRAEQVQASVPGAPPLQISAPTSDWDLRNRVAIFTGDVVVTRADVTLRTERLTVRFASREKLERAVAEGKVVVTQGERVATAGKAELVAATGEIVLTGAPIITEGPNRMAGDRITLWLDDERVRCEGCRLLVDGEALGAP